MVTALVMSGCLGRSLATDSSRLLVRWTLEPTAACGPQAPMMRIRSVPGGGDPDDEELDWLPCLDASGAAQGITAPLPLAVYDVTVGMAPAIDGPIFVESTTVTADLREESEELRDVVVVFGPPVSLPDQQRGAEDGTVLAP